MGPFLQGMPRLRQVEVFAPEETPPTFDAGCWLPAGISRLVMVPAPPVIPDCVLQLTGLRYLDVGSAWQAL